MRLDNPSLLKIRPKFLHLFSQEVCLSHIKLLGITCHLLNESVIDDIVLEVMGICVGSDSNSGSGIDSSHSDSWFAIRAVAAEMSLLATIVAVAFGSIFLFFVFSSCFPNCIDIHCVGVTACQSVGLSRPVVVVPGEQIRSWTSLLKWVVLFKGLNLEPVAVVLLRTLHPLGKVLGGVLENTGVGEGALQPLRKHSECPWLVQLQSSTVGKVLEFRNILIELSLLHMEFQ